MNETALSGRVSRPEGVYLRTRASIRDDELDSIGVSKSVEEEMLLFSFVVESFRLLKLAFKSSMKRVEKDLPTCGQKAMFPGEMCCLARDWVRF